jgi:phage terminase large subunit-like protein
VALAATLATAETVVRRAQTDRLAGYRPYPKQRDFHDAGAAHRERLLMAGNQVGKTWAAACEVAMHLTGRYPAWWRGRRFDHAVRFWAAGVTMVGTRDNPQRLLVGPPQREEDWGTAAIPAECLDGYSRARGTADALDSVVVRHAGGGHSYLGFKAYEQGRKKWQGETLHGVWFDEEPPEAIYMEGLSRTNATGGITMITFTPLLGLSRVVRMFLSEGDVGAMGSSFAKTTEGR